MDPLPEMLVSNPDDLVRNPRAAEFSTQALKRARIATSLYFLINGLIAGTLASRLPAIKAHAHLTDGTLGLCLLGVPIGGVLSMKLCGHIIGRWGSKPITVLGAFLLTTTVIPPVFATRFWELLPCLAVMGIGMGLTDVAMNAHAVVIEHGYRRTIMSAFHGFFSLGTLAGATVGSVAAHLSGNAQPHIVSVGLVAMAVGFLISSLMLPGSADSHRSEETTHGDARARWSKALIVLGLVGFCGFLAEGAAGDWSAVYIHDHLHVSPSTAAIGYAAFTLMMVSMRFVGDRLVDRFGTANALLASGTIALFGLLLALATENLALTIVGWGLDGLGASLVVPLAFKGAGNLPGVPHGDAIAKVAGFVYSGGVLAPPLVGFLAQATSLRVALLLPAVGALLVVVAGPPSVRTADTHEA